MNLFIETPQQEAERLLRDQRRQIEELRRLSGQMRDPSQTNVLDAARLWQQSAPQVASASAAALQQPAAEPYSVAQDGYEKQIRFDKRRQARARWAGVARVLLVLVLVPMFLFAAFIASYVLTCIINGATPAELGELMMRLFEKMRSFVAAVPLGFGR